MVYGNEAAFPFLVPENNYCAEGLTKREYFAGLAMQSLITPTMPEEYYRRLSEGAVKAADALLTELEKQK